MPSGPLQLISSIQILSLDFKLSIYNIIGSLVKNVTFKQNQQPIYIGDLSNGIYIIEIESGQWTEKQKLIIQR